MERVLTSSRPWPGTMAAAAASGAGEAEESSEDLGNF
jgi:hypothetical protein